MKNGKSIVLYAFLSVMTACNSALSYDIIPVSKYPGDLNSDRMVDYNDLFIFASQWLQSPGDPNADIAPNGGDGIVNFLDFSVLAKDWGENFALTAARSGYDCAKYLTTTVAGLPNTGNNTISSTEATTVWNTFCSYVQAQKPGGQTVPAPTRFTDANGSGDQLVTATISCGEGDVRFILRFYRYDSDSNTIKLESIGIDGGISKKITIDLKIQKSAEVLKYAIATQCRIWITGDTTIHGNIYSSWKYQNLSPFNMTSDSKVEGTINTVLTNINPSTEKPGPDLYADTTKMPYHLETLDANGNPVYDANGNKITSPTDEIQGQCEGINYGIPPQNMPGMEISDYDTTIYYNATRTINGGNGDITTSTTTRPEYFPNGVNSDGTNNYQKPVSGSLSLTRHVYTNQTFTNRRLKASDNALFQNCTFNGVLFVDCSGNVATGAGTSKYNNIRFDNCTFNGTIVSNTPQTFNWQKNTLYFTGSATFQNNTDADATILAPNFNIDIGNANPVAGTDNVLHGAIVGGIVDVRGNAEVFGTIISMADTSSYTSGYVTNIGATLSDSDGGGADPNEPPPEAETVAIGDIGTISITPDPAKLLPSGITTPIVIVPLQDTYRESEYAYVKIATVPLDNDPNWITQGQWQFGTPMGIGSRRIEAELASKIQQTLRTIYNLLG